MPLRPYDSILEGIESQNAGLAICLRGTSIGTSKTSCRRCGWKTPMKKLSTDGSTDPKGRSGNSGVGIALTDSKNNPIWSGGMAVRSDGNNFIPEIAAALVVIKACPAALKLTFAVTA